MKKLINKLRRRGNIAPTTRITSETIDQHRQHILAGGRRFKYPFQYARHKLVINAVIISLVAIIIALAIGWWQLYPAQNTSEFMYRVTKVIPMPVAYVDGQPVLYSDYLMKYISSIRYLERKEQLNTKTDDGKRQVEYIKQKSMQYVIANAYATKLSKGLGLSVSDSELEVYLKELRQTSAGEISEQTNNAVILDYYGWSPDEYRYIIRGELLRQKVSYAMDKDALAAADSIQNAITKDPNVDFKTLAATTSAQTSLKVTYGTSGLVPKTNQDGGLAIQAAKLNKLESSSVIKSTSGAGYYFIRLINSNDNQVSYDYINIPLSTFTNALEKISKSDKVVEYISIPKN